MSDDLIRKLRTQIGDDIQEIYDHEALFKLAADRIEQLEAELKEARMQSLVDLGQAHEAYEAQKKAEAEGDAAYRRGLEDAAKIAQEKHRIASDAYLREEALGIRSVINAIRAKMENDG